MYTKSKYIVGLIEDKYGFQQPCAIVFPETVGHNNVSPLFVTGTITSAGFCHYETDEVVVYGESISLRIKSLSSDNLLVGRAMGHPKYATY